MPRPPIAAALLAIALGAAAQEPASPPQVPVPEALALRAAQRMGAGDLRGAMADVNEALARDSRHAGAYALRGTLRLTGGDRAGAIADMTRAIELAPQEPGIEVVYANRANAFWLEGRNAEALGDTERALALNPAHAAALHMRARLRADQGDLDGARDDLDRALALAPKMMSAYETRAAVHLLAGRLQEAIADYRTLMWSVPRDADAVAGRGIVRGLLGETAPALDDLTRARAMNPLAVFSGDRGPASSPARRLEQYREMNPNDPRAHLMAGVLRAMNGNVELGLKELDRAVELDPMLRADAELVRGRISR
jgi:tetratricopeptide (TPR) repeat protein